MRRNHQRELNLNSHSWGLPLCWAPPSFFVYKDRAFGGGTGLAPVFALTAGEALALLQELGARLGNTKQSTWREGEQAGYYSWRICTEHWPLATGSMRTIFLSICLLTHQPEPFDVYMMLFCFKNCLFFTFHVIWFMWYLHLILFIGPFYCLNLASLRGAVWRLCCKLLVQDYVVMCHFKKSPIHYLLK